VLLDVGRAARCPLDPALGAGGLRSAGPGPRCDAGEVPRAELGDARDARGRYYLRAAARVIVPAAAEAGHAAPAGTVVWSAW
jgi:hypothetical protein